MADSSAEADLAGIPLGAPQPAQEAQATPPSTAIEDQSLAGIPLADAPLKPESLEVGSMAAEASNSQRLTDSFQYAKQITPEDAGRIVSLSKKTGLDPAYVAANQTSAKAEGSIPSQDELDDTANYYPKTADFLANPVNAAMAKDDLDNLRLHEGLLGRFDDAWRTLKANMAVGVLQARKSMLYAGSIIGKDNSARIADVESQISQYPPSLVQQKGVRGLLGGAAQFVPQVAESAGAGAAGALTGAGIAAVTFPPAIPLASEFGYMGGEGVYWGAQIAGQAKEQLAKIRDKNGQPLSEGIQRVVAAAIGIAGAAPSILTANNVLNSTPAGREVMSAITRTVGKDVLESEGWREALIKFAKGTLEQAGVMGANMAALTGLQGEGNILAKHLSGQPFAPSNPVDLIKQMGEAGAAGAGTGLILGLPGLSYDLTSEGMRMARDEKLADQSRQFMQQLSNASVKSKLRARDEDGYEEHVDNMADGTAAKNVYIPAEAFNGYFQSANINPESAAQELGASDSYAEAQKTGGSVAVPLGAFQSEAMDGHRPNLLNDISFDPEIPTRNQIQEARQESAAAMENEVGKAQDAVAKDKQVKTNYDAIYNDVLTRMGALERPAAFKTNASWQEAMEAYAKLTASHAVAESGRRGQDVMDYYNVARTRFVGPDDATAPAASASGTSEASGRAFPERPASGATPGSENPSEAGQTLFQSPMGPFEPSITENPLFVKALDEARPFVGDNPTKEQAIGAYKDALKQLHDIHNEAQKGLLKNLPPEEEETLSGRVNEAFQKTNALRRLAFIAHNGDKALAHFKMTDADQTPEKALEDPYDVKPRRLEQGEGNPRGFYDPAQRVIGFMKSADASTFLHESAHAWLEDDFRYFKSGAASAQYKADWKALSDWLDLNDKQTELTRDQHEKFAAGFEKYLSDGRAPSSGLRRIFGAFRRWLTKIYGSAGLSAEVSAPVRAVMDRMLASEHEITSASKRMGFLDEDTLSKLDPEEADWIRAAQQSAHEEAVSKVMKEQMSEITAKNIEFLNNERAKATTEAIEAVHAAPSSLAEADIARWYGQKQDPRELAAKYRAGELDDKATRKFDDIAEERGFQNGDEMAQTLQNLPPQEEQIQQRVDQHMSQFKALKDTEKIRERAEEAVHNEHRLEILAAEHAMLEDAGKKALISQNTAERRAQRAAAAQAAKETAREILANKPADEATAYKPYATAEKNAAVKAALAAKRDDMERAAKYKSEQMLNHALYLEAMRNKAKGDKSLRFLDKFTKQPQDFKNMPYGFIRQIYSLLSRAGLMENRPEDLAINTQIASKMAKEGKDGGQIADATGLVADDGGRWHPETLPQFIERMQDDYRVMPISPNIAAQNFKPYPAMNFSDLNDLTMASRVISEMGRAEDRFLSLQGKIGIRDAAAAIRESIEKNIGKPYEAQLEPGHQRDAQWKDKLAAIGSVPDAIIPSLVTLRSLAYYLDRGPEGPVHDYIFNPLADAQSWKMKRQAEMTEALDKLIAEHYTPKEFASFKTERTYSFEGRKWTKEELLAIGLNWGAQSNRDRIMAGFGMDQGRVENMLSALNGKDWNFIQSVWDHLETYWPEIKAQEMDVNGFEPQKIQPVPLQTAHGTFRGGYYPLAYDFEKSADAYRTEEQKNALYKQYSAVAAHTDHGFTMARVKKLNRPVRLSLDVLFNHLDNVVHDLAYRKPVIDVARMLRTDDIKESLANALNMGGLKTFNDTLKAVASDQGEFLTGADRALRWFRFGSTFATLGYRLYTFPLRLAGDVVNSAWELGPTKMLGAMKDYYMNPDTTKSWVDGKSELMKGRAMTRDATLLDIARKWKGDGAGWRRHAFIVDTLADQLTAYPMWAQVYRDALGAHDEKTAVRLADDSVARSFGSGTTLDQVGMQRGTEFNKLMTMYYSWMSMMFNRAWVDGKIAGLEYNKGNTWKAASVVGRASLYSFVLPAVYENVVREFTRNAQNNDPNARHKRELARVLELPFGYLPILRDIAAPVINTAMGQYGGDYKLTPMEDDLNTVLRVVGKTAEIAMSDNRHFDEPWSEDAARAAAVLFRYPQQLNAMVFNFLDWMHSDGAYTWRDLVTKRTKN